MKAWMSLKMLFSGERSLSFGLLVSYAGSYCLGFTGRCEKYTNP